MIIIIFRCSGEKEKEGRTSEPSSPVSASFPSSPSRHSLILSPPSPATTRRDTVASISEFKNLREAQATHARAQSVTLSGINNDDHNITATHTNVSNNSTATHNAHNNRPQNTKKLVPLATLRNPSAIVDAETLAVQEKLQTLFKLIEMEKLEEISKMIKREKQLIHIRDKAGLTPLLKVLW